MIMDGKQWKVSVASVVVTGLRLRALSLAHLGIAAAALNVAVFGFAATSDTFRYDLQWPSAPVELGPVLQIDAGKVERVRAARATDGTVHLLVMGGASGKVKYITADGVGVKTRTVLNFDGASRNAGERSLFDLAIDPSDQVHVVVGKEHRVLRGGAWVDEPDNPCEIYARGKGQLACAFRIGGKDFGVKGQPGFGILLPGALLPIPWYTYPDLLAIARRSETGWDEVAIVESGERYRVFPETLAVDSKGRVHLFYVRVKRLAISLPGDNPDSDIVYGVFDYRSDAPQDGVLPMLDPKGSPRDVPFRIVHGSAVEVMKHGLHFAEYFAFMRRISVDPESGTSVDLEVGQFQNQWPPPSSTSIRSKIVFGSRRPTAELLGDMTILRAVDRVPKQLEIVPAGRGWFHAIIDAEAGSKASGILHYYLMTQNAWSAPVVLDADHPAAISGYSNRADIAGGEDGRAFVVWIDADDALIGRWVVLQSR